MNRELAPRAPFYRWVEEEYRKRGIDPDKRNPIALASGGPIFLQPEDRNLVYKNHSVWVYVYGESDETRRKSIIVSLRKKASTDLHHKAQVRFYGKYNPRGNPEEPFLIEEFGY